MTDFSTKYACVKLLKDKIAKAVLHGFVKIVNKFKRKPNKLWLAQRKHFFNSPMQKWLDDNDNLMYFKHIERQSVVAERFTKTF